VEGNWYKAQPAQAQHESRARADEIKMMISHDIPMYDDIISRTYDDIPMDVKVFLFFSTFFDINPAP